MKSQFDLICTLLVFLISKTTNCVPKVSFEILGKKVLFLFLAIHLNSTSLRYPKTPSRTPTLT